MEEDFISIKDDREFRRIVGIDSLTQLMPIEDTTDDIQISLALAEIHTQLGSYHAEVAKITNELESLERKLVKYCGMPITIRTK